MSSSDSRRDGLRRPRALASAATFASAPRAAPRAVDGHGSEASAGGRRRATAAAPWLTRWFRAARESTVRLATRSRVPQAHWLGGRPPWLGGAGHPGRPGLPGPGSTLGDGQPAWFGRPSPPGWVTPAVLARRRGPGWVAATQAGWPHTDAGHIRTLSSYLTVNVCYSKKVSVAQLRSPQLPQS